MKQKLRDIDNDFDMDLIIGCTALTHNYTLVTNNTKHFIKIPGIKIENWAE